MDDLTPDDVSELENLCLGGLMRKVTPPEIESKFMEMGYVRKAAGGLLPTRAGYKLFMKSQGK